MQLLFHYRSLFFNKLTYLDQNKISLKKMDNPAVADHPNIIMRFCEKSLGAGLLKSAITLTSGYC